MLNDLTWRAFEKTGSIVTYLLFKQVSDTQHKVEAAKEITPLKEELEKRK